MPSVRHQLLVQEALKRDPKARTGPFAKALATALAADGCSDYRPGGECCEDGVPQRCADCERTWWRMVRDEIGGKKPDAFAVDVEAREVRIYEAEITSSVKDDKLRSYADLWFMLGRDWALRLIVIGPGGHLGDIDLMAAWYAFNHPDLSGTELHALQIAMHYRHDGTDAERALARKMQEHVLAVLRGSRSGTDEENG